MPHSLKVTEAGEMHIITLGGITSYHIFTKAGFFRGGKIYSTDKIFRVLSGEVEYIHEEGGLDVHETLTPESGEKIIHAGIAHIFRAVTHCVFIESFPENTKNMEYERYTAKKHQVT